MQNNLEKYVPEAAGQDLAPSAVTQYLSQHFGDTARLMASQWYGINGKMIWLESYNNENELRPLDGESEEDTGARIEAFFDELKETDPDRYDQEYNDYFAAATLYYGLYDTPYSGEWGETLGDFFNPADGTDYGTNADNFLPLAAALSDGQRSALELIPLSSMILLGFQNEETIGELMPNVDEILGDADEISIYSGINRGIFRGGVALTREALFESKYHLLQRRDRQCAADGRRHRDDCDEPSCRQCTVLDRPAERNRHGLQRLRPAPHRIHHRDRRVRR